jgi:acetyl esterase/lipase
LRRHLAVLLAAAVLLALPAAAAAQYPYSQEPVHDPIEFTPPRPRATVVLVHAGGWAGADRRQQDGVWQRVSPALTAKGHRVVSLDYGPGAVEGLAAVIRAVDAERAAGAKVVCLYGESAGGHLALLAAELDRDVDCVATFAAPTHFGALRDAAAEHPEWPGYGHVFHNIIEPVFGSDPAGWEPWEPARHVDGLEADLLLMRGDDDPVIPPGQVDRVARQVPTARTYSAAPAPTAWVHGTAAPGPVLDRLVDLVDRAVALRRIARDAERSGCPDATVTGLGERRLRRATACLLPARVVAGTPRGGARASFIGPVTPAAVADALRRSPAARRLLRGPVTLRVTPGAPTRVRVAHAPSA